MSNFYLVRLDPDGEKPLHEYGTFENGPDAAKQAKTLAEQFGVKVQPRRIRQAPDWKARQRRRLESGELKPLPPEWDLKPIEDHFAHLSPKSNRLIAYTENEQKGILDKATQVRPAAYLKRYYPDLSDPFDLKALERKLAHKPDALEIEKEKTRLQENARKRYAGYIDKGDGLHFAWTPDEIEWVYENGSERIGLDEYDEVPEDDEDSKVTSCMTLRYHRTHHNPNGSWTSGIHPVRVYGAGDLAIAYTTGKSGNVSERAICWPERKVYGRVYSDGSHRLVKLLKAEGYREFSAKDLEGARLLKMIYRDTKRDPAIDYFVMPHIDASPKPGTGALYVKDSGEFLTITAKFDRDRTMETSQTIGFVRARYATPDELKEAA
jgi:hypothetical protein